ncbi:MAG: ABC transporter permease subunit [Holophaga sp.]|nr:ABC transporter permease subunit [Holophaga sp.]
MTRFLVRRALGLIPTLFLILTLSFIIIRVAPGGPFASEKQLPPEIMANIEKRYHLDEPVARQYLRYLGDFVRGDLGPSFRYKDFTVGELIGNALPPSMLIGSLALAIAVLLGVGAGVLSALRQNSWIDHGAMALAVIGISVPLFVIGPVLKLVLALDHRWLPTSGWLGGRGGWLVLVMPVATLALPYLAGIARLTRASVLEVLRADYVRTARAKGLSEPVVVLRHVLKGALLPVLSYLGPAFAGIITGTVVVETIFAIPGMGRLSIQAAINRDYTLIMGDVIVFSVILVVMNFVVDVCYGFLDPRISYS